MVFVSFDGGCLKVENEGSVAVYGFTIRLENKIWQAGKVLGVGPDMHALAAEYAGLLNALRALNHLIDTGKIPRDERILISGDSKVVVERVNGIRGGRNPHPKFPELNAILKYCQENMPATAKLSWVSRTKNKTADALCNRALNEWKVEHGMRLKRPNGIKTSLSTATQFKRARKDEAKVLAKEGDWEKAARLLGYKGSDRWSAEQGKFVRRNCGNYIPHRFRPLFGEMLDVWNKTPPFCECGKCMNP